MSEQVIIQVLNESAQQGIPDTLDLWPGIKDRVEMQLSSAHRWRSVRFVRMAYGLVGIILFLILALALSPDFRTAAAHGLQRILAGVSERSDGSIQFEPAPPFVVKQPRTLSPDFRLTVSQYVPGTGIAANQEAKRLPNLPTGASAIAQQALKRDWGNAAHLILVYETPQGRYLLISERKAISNESLPIGETRRLVNSTATLRRTEDGLQLTWIDQGTWIAIEANTAEEEILRIAESFVTTQAAVSTAEQKVQNTTDASVQSTEMPFCDTSQQPARGPLLGNVNGQVRKGSVTIELFDRAMYPETVAYGSDVPDRREVLTDALRALRDFSLPMQRLPYASISSFRKNDSEDCLRPNPQVQGYIITEVWQHQVNLGYGGTGAQMKERAIRALENELNTMP